MANKLQKITTAGKVRRVLVAIVLAALWLILPKLSFFSYIQTMNYIFWVGYTLIFLGPAVILLLEALGYKSLKTPWGEIKKNGK